MRVSASFALDRDRTARPANGAFNSALAAGGVSSFPPRNVLSSRHPTRLGAASPTRAIPEAFRKRTLPGRAAQPARLAFRAAKTQYKCGKSRLRNNHPLGKPGYDQRLLLAPGSLLRWSEKAAATGLSNGVQMLVHSATDGSTKTPAIRAMEWSLLEAFRTVGLKA